MSERDIVERLSSLVTDWDGSDMKDGEPPIDDIRCMDLRQAAAEILRLRHELAEAAKIDWKHLYELSEQENTNIRAQLTDARRAGWIAGRDAASEVVGRSPVHSRKPPRDTSSWAMGVEDAMIDIAAYIREQELPA